MRHVQIVNTRRLRVERGDVYLEGVWESRDVASNAEAPTTIIQSGTNVSSA